VQNSTSKPSVGTLSTTDLAISVYPEGYGTGLNDYTAGESIKSTGTFSATPDAGYQFTQGYAGFTINPNATAQPLYGWAQFEYNSTSGVATLVDWAYNTTPGADIAAGEMSAVPEPADTAVIMGAAALLAGSVAIWRKREGASVAA